MKPSAIAFASGKIDRTDYLRSDAAQLAGMRARRDARVLMLDGLLPVLEEGGLVWRPIAADDSANDLIFLGLMQGAPRFVAVPQHLDDRPAFAQRAGREALTLLGRDGLAIYGMARSLVDWHTRHRFCANCGARIRFAKGGWQRLCGGCGAQHFVRTDPVVIMLVEHDGDLLLGRGHGFPPGLFSALAGFVEPGETIEEAVAREVHEEVGIGLGDVRYIASQPWPFPAQLMIGCHAHATSRTLSVDASELDDARWFSRAQIKRAMRTDDGEQESAGSFHPPMRVAIAYHLLEWWLARGA